MSRVTALQPYGVLLSLLTLSTLAAFYLYEPGAPFIPLGNDSLHPEKVKRGDDIYVLRTFRVAYPADILVKRTMVRGDCATECEVIGLQDSDLKLQPGVYRDAARVYTVPNVRRLGVWRMVFFVHWSDFKGRQYSIPLTELPFEIVE